MNGRHHVSLTEAIAARIFDADAAKEIASWAAFPDSVEDISVEGHGTHMLGRNCAPFTHFTVQYGQTWRGYAWHLDPSLPHIDLPNRVVSVNEMAWQPVFGGVERLLVASRHPEATLLDVMGYSKFMDETTFCTGASMAHWIGTALHPTRAAAGASVHFVQDACVREHCTGALLGRHSVRESMAEKWWFDKMGSARVKKMLDVAEKCWPGLPKTPRSCVELCSEDTMHLRDPWCRPYSDGQMVKMHQRAIWYTAALLWWWAERGLA